MHRLYELKDKLIQELEDYSENGKYSKEDVEAIKYMASAVDHICNIVERAEDDEYSNAMDGGSYARDGRGGRSYYDGRRYTYAQGRGRNARRDSMGRYSRAEDDIKMQLQEIMEDAPNEQIRMEIQRLVNRIDKM